MKNTLKQAEIFLNKTYYMNNTFVNINDFIKKSFPEQDAIQLHEPLFVGNEYVYVKDAIDSTFVSSVGKYVDRFEEMICDFTGSKYAIATVNGTAALHASLILAGVKKGDLVLTQALSFVATCNAITYTGAEPIFIDVDPVTMGMSDESLNLFLEHETIIKNNICYHKKTNRIISACVPMHSFGHPCKIENISEICNKYYINLVEDAAESLGSLSNESHTGTFGLIGAYSFNGNKTITCGGGGVIVTNDSKIAKLAKHITKTAKVPHKWESVHDLIGYNYRLPNLNAAFACAQMEKIQEYIENKRQLASEYISFFNDISDVTFMKEPGNTKSNYWLNTILFNSSDIRDSFLEFSINNKIFVRPAWKLMIKLDMFKNCVHSDLTNSFFIEERAVNIPSSVRKFKLNG